MLAGYETDLMPSTLNSDQPPNQSDKIFLPATVDLRAGLGSSGSEFEARLTLNNNFPGVVSNKPNSSRSTAGSAPFSFGSSGGTSTAPSLEALVVTIPFPAGVRSVTELKPSHGEANYNTSDKTVEWKVPTKDGASINGVAMLTGTVSGPFGSRDTADDVIDASDAGKLGSMAGYYEEDSVAEQADLPTSGSTVNGVHRKPQANKALMPRSIAVSFNVKGWLPSGIKVDSLMVDVKKSKGLGDGVRPYKGVKYLTVSRQGVERRVE
jgi:hypothetical protein